MNQTILFSYLILGFLYFGLNTAFANEPVFGTTERGMDSEPTSLNYQEFYNCAVQLFQPHKMPGPNEARIFTQNGQTLILTPNNLYRVSSSQDPKSCEVSVDHAGNQVNSAQHLRLPLHEMGLQDGSQYLEVLAYGNPVWLSITDDPPLYVREVKSSESLEHVACNASIQPIKGGDEQNRLLQQMAEALTEMPTTLQQVNANYLANKQEGQVGNSNAAVDPFWNQLNACDQVADTSVETAVSSAWSGIEQINLQQAPQAPILSEILARRNQGTQPATLENRTGAGGVED